MMEQEDTIFPSPFPAATSSPIMDLLGGRLRKRRDTRAPPKHFGLLPLHGPIEVRPVVTKMPNNRRQRKKSQDDGLYFGKSLRHLNNNNNYNRRGSRRGSSKAGVVVDGRKEEGGGGDEELALATTRSMVSARENKLLNETIDKLQPTIEERGALELYLNGETSYNKLRLCVELNERLANRKEAVRRHQEKMRLKMNQNLIFTR